MPYHYKECGLPNIWLQNGFAKAASRYGEALKIHNVLGLHKLIGQAIAKNPKLLSGPEFRFLRREMELSQKSLAENMGVDEQRVARFEKEKSKMDPLADRLLRGFYMDYINGQPGITELVEQLNEADAKAHSRLSLKFDHCKWRVAA